MQTSGLTLAKRLAALFFGMIVFAVLYVVRARDTDLIASIPVPMVMISISVPALLALLIFWFARRLERHDWLKNDE